MRISRRGCCVSLLILVALASGVWPTSTAAGEAGEKVGHFITYDNGTALDTLTQLMWMTKDFRNLEGRAPNDGNEAVAWAEKMNQQRYGGYSDWRVPTTEEYATVYDREKTRTTYQGQAVGYPDVFDDGGGSWYWTDEGIFAGATEEGWGLLVGKRVASYTLHEVYGYNFRRGQTSLRYIEQAKRGDSVRLVRAAPSEPQRIAVLKSHDLAPFNLAWAGFSVACRQRTRPTDTYDLGGSSSNAKDIIDRIMANNYTLVLAIGPLATQVARAEVRDIPVVFVMAPKPRQESPHGVHMTGISLYVSIETQLTTYTALLPAVRTLGVIYDPDQTGAMVTEAGEAAKKLGLQLMAVPIASHKEVAAALRKMLGKIDALWMLPDTTVVTRQSFKFFALTALKNRLPLLTMSEVFVEAGALAALSSDYLDIGRQSCELAKEITSGRLRPAEVNVIPPEKVNLAINLKVAKKIGLKLPPALVESAHNVFQ
ncbi:MAG: ABC transporter substrate binding protein [Candidatus Tectomicrobia bacterium]